jgi:hypothetical protein
MTARLTDKIYKDKDMRLTLKNCNG